MDGLYDQLLDVTTVHLLEYLKYKIKVLVHTCVFPFYVTLYLHMISQGQFFSSEQYFYLLVLRIQSFIHFLSSKNNVSPNLVVLDLNISEG